VSSGLTGRARFILTTTDELYELFRKERSVYRIAGVGGVMAVGCGIHSHKPRSCKLGSFRMQYLDDKGIIACYNIVITSFFGPIQNSTFLIPEVQFLQIGIDLLPERMSFLNSLNFVPCQISLKVSEVRSPIT